MRTAKKARGQGRPSVDRAVGEKALIAGVRTALRTTPPGELTFQQVASIAGVNQRLIRYYFGTMLELLRATAIEVTHEIRSRIKVANSLGGPIRDQIRRRVSIFLETFGANPHYHRLVVDYLFTSASKDRDEAIDGLRNSIVELDQLLQESHMTSGLKPIDARLAHVTMAALCEFLFSAKPVFIALFGEEAKTDAFHERMCDFVTDLLFAPVTLGQKQKKLV